MKSGWHGKVMDSLRSLYKKTSSRVKNKGWISFLIHNAMGVNQGGVASGLLFRKYMADMGGYLKCRFGVCIGEVIIMHLLWADDLILIADTCNGLQRQLDGLQEFCSKNLTAVNEIKTKCMAFGKIETVQVNFNGKAIEQVYQYQFLGIILKSAKRLNQSIFAENHLYLANQAKKAVGSMYSRIRDVGTLQPHTMLHMYDRLVKPITVYGSEVWGHHHPAQSEADKIFFRFARQVLRVKLTTSNIVVRRLATQCAMYYFSAMLYE